MCCSLCMGCCGPCVYFQEKDSRVKRVPIDILVLLTTNFYVKYGIWDSFINSDLKPLIYYMHDYDSIIWFFLTTYLTLTKNTRVVLNQDLSLGGFGDGFVWDSCWQEKLLSYFLSFRRRNWAFTIASFLIGILSNRDDGVSRTGLF